MSRSGRLMIAAVLVGLPAAGTAQRQLVEVVLLGDRPLVRTLTAPPRDFVELCTRQTAGSTFDWAFEAEAPVAFNTHFHMDGALKYPQGLFGIMAAKGRLAPGETQHHCWLWSNPGMAPVNVRMQITP